MKWSGKSILFIAVIASLLSCEVGTTSSNQTIEYRQDSAIQVIPQPKGITIQEGYFEINETTTLLNTKLINRRFVEIEYTPEQNKPKLEYIMTDDDINELLSKYGYVMK